MQRHSAGNRQWITWSPFPKTIQDIRHLGIDYRQRISVPIMGMAAVPEHKMEVLTRLAASVNRDPVPVWRCLSRLSDDDVSAKQAVLYEASFLVIVASGAARENSPEPIRSPVILE